MVPTISEQNPSTNELDKNPQLTFAIWRITISVVHNSYTSDLGRIIKQRRATMLLTLGKLSAESRVSPSHLGRIEKGERFPSARTLRKIAKPLGFEEDELFSLAGYLSPQPPSIAEGSPEYSGSRLDPYVASLLAREPADVQHTVVEMLSILKSLARSMSKEGS